MNKKKHQSDFNADDSNDSCDENRNTVECVHIKKSVDLPCVKRVILKTGFMSDCEPCSAIPDDPDMLNIEYDLSLWLCLKCGNQACGRGRNKHALDHYNTPHSDSHALCVNTTVWSVWCYECDNEINASCKAKLLEAVEFLRKLAQRNRNNPVHEVLPMPSVDDMIFEVANVTPETTGAIPKVPSFNLGGLPRARGLVNLGNTCFFNSVMQCLGQTPHLLNLLEETSQPGQHFELPGGKLEFKENKQTIVLEPLDGTLDRWKPLTATLAETLRELQSGSSDVYVPRMLLSKLTSRMPQFGGGDQHDSHELLRNLLEAVREEDLKRYKTIILEKLVSFTGFNNKTDPRTVEGDKKQMVKFYGQQASEMLLPTEQVFRGVLVSTLQCQVCGHTSHRDEFFLDLSLPISEKQLQPIVRRRADDIEDNNKPSKHQLKKQSRAARKANKPRNKSRVVVVPKAVEDINNKMVVHNNSETDSDVEVEITDQERTVKDGHSTNLQFEDILKGLESGYNSDKIDNSSPENNRGASPDMRVDDSGVPSPIVSLLDHSPISPDNSPASSETNVDMGSPLCGHNSPNEDDIFERPESRLAIINMNNTDLKVDLAKLSLLNDGDSSRINMLYNADDTTMDGAYGSSILEPEKMDEDFSDDHQVVLFWPNDVASNSIEDALGDNFNESKESTPESIQSESDDLSMPTSCQSDECSLQARYQCEEGECSVQSCLNQFTECELMAGNNRVSCELCTKRHKGDKKMVYTDASKQLLIYNPPAVLILHLKRFQVLRYRSAKVNKFVKFSMLLDLAPFCSRRSQNLPTFQAGQTKVLYSLYGVVEHSGSMHGGHYVSYIKVRPQLEQNSYRWQFLPKNQRNCVPRGEECEPEVPSGKWYYISDSYVSEVTEAKVLAAQAYLLFYERIL